MTTLYIQEFRTEDVLFATEDFNTVPREGEDIFIEGTWYTVKEVNHYYRHLNTMDGNSVTLWVEKCEQDEHDETDPVEGEPLMEKPADEEIMLDPHTGAISRLSELSQGKFYGHEMENDKYTFWHFPKGVKEKIKKDSRYYVYYHWHDTADSSDPTTYYDVYYIEEL